jgi:2-polyprenyl-6-methoxyphenol hydroxylase-like FAD-dependent oxidoreductase
MVRTKAADVVVVGARLVGMTEAALLAAEGRASRRRANPTTSDEPKAISLDDEALRVYQGASLTERILAVIVPRIGTWHFDARGRPCSRLGRRSPTGSAIRFTSPFAQPDLERELHEHLLAQEGLIVRMAAHRDFPHRPAPARSGRRDGVLRAHPRSHPGTATARRWPAPGLATTSWTWGESSFLLRCGSPQLSRPLSPVDR